MTLATQTGLSDLFAEKVRIAEPRIKSGSAKLVNVVRRRAFDAPTPGSDSISGRPVRRSATNLRFGSIAWRLTVSQISGRPANTRGTTAGNVDMLDSPTTPA